MGLESAGDGEVGVGYLSRFIFDAKGLNPHAYNLIYKVLFRIRESSPCFFLDQQFAVTGSGLEQDARRVADDSGHLARLVTAGAELVNSFVVIKRILGPWPPTNNTASSSSTFTFDSGFEF